MAELGGGGEQLRPLLAMSVGDAAGEVQHGEGKHRLAIAAVGSQLVPFGRFLVVALDPESVGIELAEQRHRLDVFPLLRPLGRDRKGREIGPRWNAPAAMSSSRWGVGASAAAVPPAWARACSVRLAAYSARASPQAWPREGAPGARAGELGRRLRRRARHRARPQCDADDAGSGAPGGGHASVSVRASRRAASATAAEGPSGSVKTQSMATKSAPAAASGPTSSSEAANPTQGLRTAPPTTPRARRPHRRTAGDQRRPARRT